MPTKWWFFIGAAGVVGVPLVRSGVPLASVVLGVALAGVMTGLDARRRRPSHRPGR